MESTLIALRSAAKAVTTSSTGAPPEVAAHAAALLGLIVEPTPIEQFFAETNLIDMLAVGALEMYRKKYGDVADAAEFSRAVLARYPIMPTRSLSTDQLVMHWAVPRISAELARQYLDELKALNTPHARATVNMQIGTGLVCTWGIASAMGHLRRFVDDTYAPDCRSNCIVDVISCAVTENGVTTPHVFGYGGKYEVTPAPSFGPGLTPAAEQMVVRDWIIASAAGNYTNKADLYARYTAQCMVLLTREDFDEHVGMCGYRTGLSGYEHVWMVRR